MNNSKKTASQIAAEILQKLMACTTSITERGVARFRRRFSSIPKGWSYDRGTFSPRHDRDLRVFVTIEDEFADRDIFDALTPELMNELRAAGVVSEENRDPRPPTYHISASRSARPVSEADIEIVTRIFVPSVASWDSRITRTSPSPYDPSKTRNIVHLFAPVPPCAETN